MENPTRLHGTGTVTGPRANDQRLTRELGEVMPALLRFLERRVGTDDAPDLLGETLVVAWRRVADLPEDAEDARMWLFGIARGTILNHARGERRRLALAQRIRQRLSIDNASAPADAGADVRDAIDRLGDDFSDLIKLVHWDGFTLAEAGELLGIPTTTARSRYRRAREELRATLNEDATKERSPIQVTDDSKSALTRLGTVSPP